MRERPILSVCVPSRNRQKYFKSLIDSLLANPRTDVEFIFADNSDDPSIMADFLGRYDSDRRIVFLPAGSETLSMRDNFERCVENASGDFVTVIGDDDFIDIDLAGLLQALVERLPETDAVSWSRPVYFWPTPEREWHRVGIQIDDKVGVASQSLLQDLLFRWKEPTGGVPNCPYSVYHGAISMKLMNRIRERFGQRYFENAAADLDNAMKVMVEGRHFIYSERPFSLAGICPESNGASFRKLSDLRLARESFLSDARHQATEAVFQSVFPFDPNLGNSVVIALAHLWFKSRYDLRFDPWESNFAKACAQSCEGLQDEADYIFAVESFRHSFSVWQDGQFLADFSPRPFAENANEDRFSFTDFSLNFRRLWIPSNIAGAKTPAAFFSVVQGILPPYSDLRHVGFDTNGQRTGLTEVAA